MADEELEIILRAVDDASSTFESVGQSAEDVGSQLQTAFEEATAEVERLEEALMEAELNGDDIEADYLADELAFAREEAEQLESALEDVNSGNFDEVSSGADEAANSTQNADQAVQELNNDLGIINASSLFDLASQMGDMGASAESMAQEMNEANISIGQLATNTGIAEPQLVDMINAMTTADFPREDALAYVEALNQMGVSAEHLTDSATAMDVIGDATGMSVQQVVSLTQSLRGLGVSADNLPSSFNAIAYAQANVNGGAETLQTVFKRQAGTLNEYGVSIDQAVVMMQALSQQGVQGMKMGSALSTVLKDNAGDMSAIEQELGLTAGTLTNASAITGEYTGKLEDLAAEEGEHKTLLDHLGAAWDDITLKVGGALSPLLSAAGALGQVGQFGLQLGGLKELGSLIQDVAVKLGFLAVAEDAETLSKDANTIATDANIIAKDAETVANTGVATSAEAAAAAEGLMLWPILLIVAAIVALIAIVYEVGKAFGWWTDVGSMIDAIWAGIQRLWSAFINHPDVQGAISAISGAFQWLMSAIGGAWNALMEFLGVSTGGEFDVVHEIIMAIGAAWEMITAPIRAIIGLVTSLISIFSQLATGQIDLQTTIGLVWNALVTFFQTMTQSIFFVVMQFAANLLVAATQAGRNLLTGVITYVSRLPGRVYTYLLNVATRIVAMGTRWVNTARQKANQMVIGIITYLMTLPGKVYNALMGVVSRITGAIHSWINAAKSKVRDVINAITSPFSGVAGAISGALSGVANAIKAPFEAAWNAIEPLISKIQDGMKLVGAAGGEMAAGGESLDVNANRSFNISTGEYVIDDSPIVIEDNLNISLDLSGVPRGVNTNELVTAIQDRNVLNALVTNRDFQDLDARVKQRINLKNVRARGR